jgi:hypothetical protein
LPEVETLRKIFEQNCTVHEHRHGLGGRISTPALELTGGATPDDGQAREMVRRLGFRGIAPPPRDFHTDSGYVSRAERKHLKEDWGVS